MLYDNFCVTDVLIRRTKPTLIAAMLLTALVTLTGRFVIPLADVRSPFDDPSGESQQEIAEAVPVVQAALDTIDTHEGAWTFKAQASHESSCEGACNLHVAVLIATPDNARQVPMKILRDVLAAAVPAAEQQRVELRIWTASDGTSQRPAMSAAVFALFGSDPATRRWRTSTYTISNASYSGPGAGGQVIKVDTRENTSVLQSMQVPDID